MQQLQSTKPNARVHDMLGRPIKKWLQHPTVLYVDLFCGAGGSTTGAIKALEELGLGKVGDRIRAIAVNHNKEALATHALNHPEAEHFPCDIETLEPETVLMGQEITILWASAPCQPWSTAAGAAYTRPQARATPEYITKWIRVGKPRVYIEENVRQIVKKWSGWKQHVREIEEEGYRVEIKYLDGRKYGSAQARERMILIAVRDDAPIVWPKETHSDPKKPKRGTRPYRSLAGLLDWDEPSTSLFAGKKNSNKGEAYSPRVRARIARYIRERGAFWEPLARAVEENAGAVPLQDLLAAAAPEDWPSWVLRTDGGAVRLVAHEFMVGQHDENPVRGVHESLPTVMTAGYMRVGEVSCVLPPRGRNGGPTSNKARGMNESLNTVLASRTSSVVEVRLVPVPPVVVPHHGEAKGQAPRYHGGSESLPTIPASRGFDVAMVTLTGGVEVGRWDARDIMVDVMYRLMTVRELARGQGFPDWYEFVGNLVEQRRQIGNAVDVWLAYAVVKAVLGRKGLLRTRLVDFEHVPHGINA